MTGKDSFTGERKDPRQVKQALDRGPVELKTRLHEEKGGIWVIANKDVVTIPRSMTIIGAAKTMIKYGFRRLPVTDPGTERLEGILTSLDLVDFSGGGNRYSLVKNRHGGKLYSAVNESVDEIMEEDVLSVTENENLTDVLAKMISRNVGGIPVTNKKSQVIGIVTERDFVWLLSDVYIPDQVQDYMTKKVVSATPDTTIKEATKTMVSKGFRRIPITRDGILVGIATSTDIVRYLGSGKAMKKLVKGLSEEAFGASLTEIMTQDVVTVNQEASLGDAVNLMTEKNLGSLPVISDGGLKGIFTERDFLKALIGE